MAFFAHKDGVYFPLDKANVLWISEDFDDVQRQEIFNSDPYEQDGRIWYKVEKCGDFSELLDPASMSRDTLYFGNEKIARKVVEAGPFFFRGRKAEA